MTRSGRASHRRWLRALTDLPTASGSEGAVVTWVKSWARQQELAVKTDAAGNLLVGPPRRSRRRPVVAVAHMDHPALIVKENGTRLTASLRGGVYPEYLDGAAVQIESVRGPVRARVIDFDPATQVAVLSAPSREVNIGDIARWYFTAASLGVIDNRLRARACDDLAGAAAALSALQLASIKASIICSFC